MRVVLHRPKGEEACKRGVLIVSIDGKPCYRVWEDRGWRWARSLDYWPDDGMGHDGAHGKRDSKAEAVFACVEHYQTRRVREEAREPREEKDIE